MTKKKHHQALLAALLAILFVVGSIVTLGVSYERMYAGKLLPGVTILGVPMGGKTYAEARKLTAQRADVILAHSLSLTYEDGATQEVTPKGLGLSLSADALVQEAYERGRSGSLVDRWSEILLLVTSGEAFAFESGFDADRALAALEADLTQHETPATDASLAYSNGQLLITDEQVGSVVDRERLAQSLEAIFRDMNLPDQVAVPTRPAPPRVVRADVEPLLALAKRATGAAIIVEASDGQRLTISPTVLASWVGVQVGEAGIELVWSQEKMSEQLAAIAKKTDRPMRIKKIDAANGQVLDEGAAGATLDQESVKEALLAALTNRLGATTVQATTIAAAVEEIPITEDRVTKPHTPGLFPGKYVEINLREQVLYQWDGEQLLAKYQVSTGKWDMQTPEGTLYVKNHIAYAYSRKYDLYMPYWLGLARNQDGSGYEGYGIHELPEWRDGTKEGESHLGRPVSHGCIRLGIGAAKNIYDWAEEGMPVYIHR